MEPKSSNLIVNEKFSRNLPNQFQQLDLKLFWYMEFGRKAKNRVEMTEPKSSNLSVNEKLSKNLPNQVQQLECEWEIVKKFTKPSPATWFESVFINGIQVKKPKTMSKWWNPSPATWLWMKTSQEKYQTKSSSLIWKCFDMWNSCQQAKNRVKMTESKSSNLNVNEKLSRNLPNQFQQLDLKLFWYMEFGSKSQKQSWNDGTQVQQLECEWEIVKKFTKPSPATWVWMINCQEIYQTKSSNLIWECFHIWNSSQKAKNNVKMMKPKSSNLIVNEKFSRNLPNQFQHFDLKLFWYMEFGSKSQKQSWNDGTQVQQLECEWEIVKKFTKPSPATWVWMRNCQEIYQTKSSNLIWECFHIWNSSQKAKKQCQNDRTQVKQLECEWENVKKFTKPIPATWFEIVLIYWIQVEEPKTELKWRSPIPATWVWMRNCQEIYKTNSSNLIWNCFDIWNSGRRAKNRVEMTEPKSSNLSVNEKLSRNLPNQVQQLECEWEIVKKFTKPSPATWFESVLIYGIQVKKPKTMPKWRNPSPATWLWMKNTQEIYQTKSSYLVWNYFVIWNSGRKAKNRVEVTPSPANWLWMKNSQEIYQTKSSYLVWNCFVIWNSGRKAKNRVEMTEPKSSNLNVNKKLSRNLPNQLQQLDLKLFWYMELRSKSQKQSWNDGTQVQQLECEWEIVKKFTKPSPATWVWMRNCQEIYQTKSSNLIWECFDIWNSSQKAKNNAKMTEPKSSNLIVNEKYSRNDTNRVQQLDLKLVWYMEFRSKSRKQSWNNGTQVQQLECEWEIVKKFTKPTPATWFGIVLIYGIQVEKPKTELKWRNPSPATWVWMRNCQEIYQSKSSNLSVNEKLSRNLPKQVQQLDLKLFWYKEFRSKSRKQSWNDGTQVQQLECEWEIVKKFTKPSPATWFESVLIYGIQVKKPKTKSKWRKPSPATWLWIKNTQEMIQTESSNLIWNWFDIWNSGRRAENRVEMTEPKSSNLSVNEKLSRNLQNQLQQLDLELFWYMEFRSKSQKQSWNDGTQVQQLECEWEIVKKFTNPSPATWVWMKNCQEIYQNKSSNLIWNCFDIRNSGRKAENRVEMTEPKSSNLSVNEKLSRNLPNQVQQLDLRVFWYMEFKSKSQKQSQNDGNQVQQLDCE